MRVGGVVGGVSTGCYWSGLKLNVELERDVGLLSCSPSIEADRLRAIGGGAASSSSSSESSKTNVR